MKNIPGNLLKKTWKNHGNIMEFCQSEKVGTLDSVHREEGGSLSGRPPWTETPQDRDPSLDRDSPSPGGSLSRGFLSRGGLPDRDPPPPPVNRITDACENITLPQLRCGR